MKKIYLYILAATASIYFVQGCITGSVSSEMEEAVANGAEGIKSENSTGALSLKIHNIAPNTSLKIDTLTICNILLEGSGEEPAPGRIKLQGSYDTARIEYEGAAICGDLTLPPQKFSPWDHTTLPDKTDLMYVRMDGTMYTYIANGELFPIYSGAMYFTFGARITENQTTQATLLIYDNCNLYCNIDGEMVKVLQSINFEPSIKDWETYD